MPQVAPEVSISGLMTLQDADLRAAVAGINCPTLVHYGANDTITPRSAGDWLSTRISEARGVCFEGVGHAPFLSQPQRTFDLWREFFG